MPIAENLSRMQSGDDTVRNEILTEAQKLFQQFGLKKTTMDEIAAACGKAKSTLYHYFTSKEEVFDAVIELETMNLRRIVKLAVDKECTLADKICAYFIAFHRESVHKANLYRIVREQSIDQKRSKELFYELLDFERNYIVRLLEDAYDSGEYRAIPKQDMPMMAELLLASFCGTVKYMVDRSENFEQEKMEQLASIFTHKMFG